MKRVYAFNFILLCLFTAVSAASPVKGLLERVSPGSSGKFIIEQVASASDFFELDQKGEKVVIRGNNPVSIATGINWYLKYHAGVHLSWNNMSAQLPAVLPAVPHKERHETASTFRYDFNYCTFSYTMAFWDWKRWEKEIDWRHSTASTFRWRWWVQTPCGATYCSSWATRKKRQTSSLPARASRHGG